MRRVLGALVLAAAACGGKPESVRPLSDFAVMRAQPAVFMLYAYGKLEFLVPTLYGLSQETPGATPRVLREYAAADPGGLSQPAWCWQRICTEPATYLWAATIRREKISFENELFGSGTAFAVDDSGTLVTNAHVVEPPDASILASTDSGLGYFVPQLNAMIARISEAIGGGLPAELVPLFVERVGAWYLRSCYLASATVDDPRLATRMKPDWPELRLRQKGSLAAQILEGKSLAQLYVPPPDTVSATVKARGEVYPGKDLAILHAPSIGGALISLPLGDSDEVELGTRIHALGFPGAAIIDGVDAKEAQFRVISHDGILDQKLRMSGGWDAFHMTASINHGDSGGPVIDGSGTVVAVNVAGNDQAAAQTLAIPVNILKEFLALHQTKVQTGPATAAWTRAIDEYRKGNYREARSAAVDILKLRQKPLSTIHNIQSMKASEDPYVRALIDRCTKAIDQGKDPEGKLAQIWVYVRILPLPVQILGGLLVLRLLVWMFGKLFRG